MTRVRRSRPPRPWKQAIYLWVGIALIPIGIVIAPLPGPGGIPVLAVAALLIITSSKRAASWVRLHRRRWDWMHEILVKGEGWLGGEMGRALRRTNGRKNTDIVKPPASRKERVLDILLFPVHIAIILTRAVAHRFGWKLPGDARKEREAERERQRLHRARRRRRRERKAARGVPEGTAEPPADDASRAPEVPEPEPQRGQTPRPDDRAVALSVEEPSDS
jgi:hypothetical protein